MIDQLRERYRQKELLTLFDVKRSSYYYYLQHKEKPDLERERLKMKAAHIHKISRGSMGSRTLSAKLKAESESVGCYKACRLM